MLSQLAISIRDDYDSIKTIEKLKQFFKLHYISEKHVVSNFINMEHPDRIIIYTNYIDEDIVNQLMDIWEDIQDHEFENISGYMVHFGEKLNVGGKLMFGNHPPMYDFETVRAINIAKTFNKRFNV